jgi:beta-glucosidase
VLDHLRRENLDLGALRVLVLDEGDRLLDMGFLPQIEEVLHHAPPRQTHLFSATFPDEVKALGNQLQKKPVEVAIVDDDVPDIEQLFFACGPGPEKQNALALLLARYAPSSALVFCHTRNDVRACPLQAAPERQASATYTETGWEVFPQGLTDTLLWIKQRYGNPPVYITENGSAFYDPPVAEAGVLHDPLRADYLRKHLVAAHAALAAGVDLRGYFAWSLLDNLEWSLGYSKRFGIIHVDFATQTRTFKDSAKLYAKIIASNGRELAAPAEQD